MKDKEIELKFVINEKIKENIIAALQEEEIIRTSRRRMIDTYYIPTFKEYEINGETMECIRIRENESGAVLGYKKIHRECDPLYCDEYETEVASKEQAEKILFAIGFNVQMIIDKTRELFVTKDYEFAFDSVKGLGELLEVELKNDDKTVEDIYNFVSRFGLTKKDVTYEGIQVMMKKANKVTK